MIWSSSRRANQVLFWHCFDPELLHCRLVSYFAANIQALGGAQALPVIPLLGADLEGARLDARLSFPGQIKQLLTDWRAGFPAITVDDHPVQVVQGAMAGGTRVKLYFDRETGLLVRLTRYLPTAVGTVATHIIYSDYRAVAGVGIKVPFHWQVTWVDGQSTIELSSVQPNVPVDAARFAKPAPPR